MKYTPANIIALQPHQIFVFGSNTQGHHGKGAAKTAMSFGAVYGQATGRQGQTYAIVTKDLTKGNRSISLDYIQEQINTLVEYATNHPELEFLVTKIGCGLGGFKSLEIAPLFPQELPENIILPKEFTNGLPNSKQTK